MALEVWVKPDAHLITFYGGALLTQLQGKALPALPSKKIIRKGFESDIPS